MRYLVPTSLVIRLLRVAPWWLLLITFNLAFAQEKPRITFQSLQDGLSNQVITCMVKDYKGYMWFGTYSGLNRYDGTNFVVYENDSATARGISHNLIGALAEDADRNLWVGTVNGLNRYNREKDCFEPLPDLDIADGLNIKALFCDKEGNIWIGTAGDGLFVYNPVSKKRIQYLHDPANPSTIGANFVKAITIDAQRNIWVGTRNGLDLFNAKEGTFTHFISDPHNRSSLSHNAVNSLLVDQGGALWVGTYGGGLNRVVKEGDAFRFQQFRKSSLRGSLSNDFVLSMLMDRQGNLWVGTENGGLNCMRPQTNQFITYASEEGNAQSLSSNSIWSLYEDPNGLLWVGTYYKGLNVYDPGYEKFHSYQRNGFKKETLVSNQVRAFAEDARGNLWIATDGGGLSYLNTRTGQFSEPINNAALSSKAVLTVLCDTRQTVWAGTWGGGVDHFSENGVKLKNYRFDGAPKTGCYNVRCLYQDRSGRIWAGTSGNGLFLYHPEEDRFLPIRDATHQAHLSEGTYVNVMLEDQHGQLWIGTSYGLIRLNTNADGGFSFTEYLYNTYPLKGTTSLAVNTLLEDTKGNLWVGTVDELNAFDPRNGRFTVFKKRDGLPGNTINGILEDQGGHLWISTNRGISQFNAAERSFKNYFREDGLTTNEFYPNACLKTRNGELFFGGNNGMTSFTTDQVTTNPIIPPVYLTGFNLFNSPVKIGKAGSPLEKSISETTHLTLNHQQTSFSFEFVALNFTHASKNQYAYMLEGFDPDWVYARNGRMATYTNLNPGTYTFKVKGSNNDEVWNPEPTTLQITILPPFWATTWAYVLYVGLFCALVWGFIRIRMHQITQAQLLQTEQRNRVKDEEINRMKVQFFTNVSHELRTPLTLILSPLEQMLTGEMVQGEVKNQVSLVYANAERLHGLVDELMDFTKLEERKLKLRIQRGDISQCVQQLHQLFAEQARRRQIDYQFYGPANPLEAWFDSGKMEKIVLNLIANAFKYTPDQGVIRVSVEAPSPSGANAPEYVTIRVTDNGSGISPQYIDQIFDRFFQSPEDETRYNTGTGIGLALVKNLVELHHGTVAVSSEKWVKTCFEVRIPLGKAHFDESDTINAPAESASSPLSQPVVPTGTANPSAHAPVILIVEDNFALRAYLASMLAGEYRVLEAPDGEAGYQMAKEEMPDLIISDIVMPRCGGIELCKKIKSEPHLSHIPVILLTAKATVGDQIAGLETGADAYATKPFNLQVLRVQIHHLIRSRRELCAHFSQDVYLRPDKRADNELDQQFLQKVTDYIVRHLSDSSLSVEALAEAVNLSRSNMYRKIKALTGTSIIDFIRMIRLKQALKLMEAKKHSLAEIAYLTGFNSPAYFTKSFREHYGKPPSEFLKS
jgi:ligand-binding sensor domain-containing protein/signal transduction histidine kinase/DNA-binding response OmpR family regulator